MRSTGVRHEGRERRWSGPLIALATIGVTLTSVGLAVTAGRQTTYAGISPSMALVTVATGVVLVAAGVSAGLTARWRPPYRTTATVTAALGLVWFAPLWVGWEAGPRLARSLAMVIVPFGVPLLLHAAAAFPSGAITRPPLRSPVLAGYALAGGFTLVRALVRDPYRDLYCWSNCTDNVFLVHRMPQLARALDRGWDATAAVLGLLTAAVAVGRLVRGSRIGRRRAWGTLVPGALAGVTLAGRYALLLAVPAENPADPRFRVSYLLGAASLVALAAGVAWATLQARRAQVALATLSTELTGLPEPGALAVTLGHALGDPGLSVAFPLGSGTLIGPDGQAAPPVTSVRTMTVVERAGVAVAEVRHDPGLVSADHLREGLGPASLLALDNERAQAVLLAQVAEVRASRARLVATSDAERRRLERDLHDGAQQVLLALTYELRLAAADAQASGDTHAEDVLAGALDQAAQSIVELRDIAHGIYPAVLAEAGLGAALELEADRSPVPVRLTLADGARCSAAAEQAVYLCVMRVVFSEPADPDAVVDVQIERSDAGLVIRISPVSTSVEAEIADRIGALGGHIRVDRGILRAEVPCA